MSIGNTKTYGNKGSNFNYQLRVLRLLDRIANIPGTNSITLLGVTGDMQLGLVPAGYMLEQIIINETAGDTVEVNIGTTNGGAEISPAEFVNASTSNVYVYNYTSGPGLNAFEVWITDTGGGWGTASCNITLMLRRVM